MNPNITIKPVGSPKFPRYVLVQEDKYYRADKKWGMFKDALLFESWHYAAWRRFNLT